MKQWLFLAALLALGSLVLLRAWKARQRRRLREARRQRRAEEARHWEEVAGQSSADDWRT
jgi:hypothetical protein